eukprot:3677004-Rhodomonas_salina.1
MPPHSSTLCTPHHSTFAPPSLSTPPHSLTLALHAFQLLADLTPSLKPSLLPPSPRFPHSLTLALHASRPNHGSVLPMPP